MFHLRKKKNHHFEAQTLTVVQWLSHLANMRMVPGSIPVQKNPKIFAIIPNPPSTIVLLTFFEDESQFFFGNFYTFSNKISIFSYLRNENVYKDNQNHQMVSAWRNLKNIFSRPLFTIIFRPEMLKFTHIPFQPGKKWSDLSYTVC